MGKKYMAEMPARLEKMLQETKNRLVKEKGFAPENIAIELVNKGHASVSEGIINCFKRRKFRYGRARPQGAVKIRGIRVGGHRVKLIRNLPKSSILVVKTD